MLDKVKLILGEHHIDQLVFLRFPEMPPSASKQKRLLEKAAKQAAKQLGETGTSTSTPTGSIIGSAANTPLTSVSAANSTDDLISMAKLQIATDRYVILRSYEILIERSVGVLLECLSLMQKVAISRSILTRFPSMAACSSRVPRYPLTMDSGTVSWVRMDLERFV